jgi:hypothetical protein
MEVASELEVVPRLRWAVIDITLVLMVVMRNSCWMVGLTTRSPGSRTHGEVR